MSSTTFSLSTGLLNNSKSRSLLCRLLSRSLFPVPLFNLRMPNLIHPIFLCLLFYIPPRTAQSGLLEFLILYDADNLHLPLPDPDYQQLPIDNVFPHFIS